MLLVGEEGDDQAAESPTITATTSDLYAKYGWIDSAYALDLVRGSA